MLLIKGASDFDIWSIVIEYMKWDKINNIIQHLLIRQSILIFVDEVYSLLLKKINYIQIHYLIIKILLIYVIKL